MTAPDSPARERLMEALRKLVSRGAGLGYQAGKDGAPEELLVAAIHSWVLGEVPGIDPPFPPVLAAVEAVVADERRKMRRTDDGRWPDDVIEIIRSQERRDR